MILSLPHLQSGSSKIMIGWMDVNCYQFVGMRTERFENYRKMYHFVQVATDLESIEFVDKSIGRQGLSRSERVSIFFPRCLIRFWARLMDRRSKPWALARQRSSPSVMQMKRPQIPVPLRTICHQIFYWAM